MYTNSSNSLISVRNSITKIFFYSSGCGVRKNCETIEEEVGRFHQCRDHCKEDLYAAAYAAYNGKPTIVCILGTGSNSCYF
ncbi:hypothetical protein [Chryseobacterium indoltheticum]|uniref:hypothetical protein n=1 Tax=Chryseobacterium indoltheticum TaxID=254 RepID=UPI003F494BDE